MTTNWLTTLLALSLAAVEVDSFTKPTFATSRGTLKPSSLRRKTALPQPYKLLDTETTDVLSQSPILLGDSVVLQLPPTESSFELPLYDDTRPTLNDVTLSLLPSKDGSANKFPLVVTPNTNSSLQFLTDFLKRNHAWVEKQILEYGAVLFRGFDVDTTFDVETAIRSFEPNLNNQYRGTSPRNAQEGSDFVFSAADVPSHYPIAQHLEMSFLPKPPRRLFFSALKAPKAAGGETALGDFRAVYRDLPSKLRNKLLEKKLRYTRTHHRKGANPLFSSDVTSMQSWPQLFGTNKKAEVERVAKQEDMPMRWEGKNHDTFVSEFVSEPFQLHPETKEPVWFNHAQVFHYSSFPTELLFAFEQTKEWRFLARAIGLGLKNFIQYGLLRRKMALHIAFGDGSRISLKEMYQIRKAIHKNMVFNRWQKGDLVFIDNFSTSHGRQPTYDKGRKVVVAWSDPLEKANELTSSTSIER